MSTQVKSAHESVSNQIKKRSEWGRQVGVKDKRRRVSGKTLNQRHRLNERTHGNVEHSVGKFTRKGTRRDIKRSNMKMGTGWKSPRKFNRAWYVTSSREASIRTEPSPKPTTEVNKRWPQEDKGAPGMMRRSYWTSRRATKGIIKSRSYSIEPTG